MKAPARMAAGGAFHHRDLAVLGPQHIAAYLGERIVAVTDEVLTEEGGAFRGDASQLRQAQLAAGRAQAAIDVSGMGAERDAEGGAVPVEDRLQLCFQSGLAHAGGADLDVGLAIEKEAERRQPRHHLLQEHGLELVGRAGQHAQDLAVLGHPEPGSRAVGVGQDLAAIETVGLLEIVRGHLAAEEGEAVEDRLLYGRIENQLQPQHLGHRLASAVIASGAQATAGDDHVGDGPALAELPGDRAGLVGDGDVPFQHDSAAAELGADEGEVPVGGQTEQEFVAQSQQFIADLGDGLAAGQAGRRIDGNHCFCY